MVKEIIKDITDRAEEVNMATEGKAILEIVENLKDTIKENNLLGLSAPQIGYDKRIFCINFNGDIRTYVNPLVTERVGMDISRESYNGEDGEKEYLMLRSPEIMTAFIIPPEDYFKNSLEDYKFMRRFVEKNGRFPSKQESVKHRHKLGNDKNYGNVMKNLYGKIQSSKFIGMAAFMFQHCVDVLDGLTVDGIGLEVDESFDNATEEEQSQIIEMYIKSLKNVQKAVEDEIEQDEDLKKTAEAIEFIEKLQKGEVQISDDLEQVNIDVLKKKKEEGGEEKDE